MVAFTSCGQDRDLLYWVLCDTEGTIMASKALIFKLGQAE